MKQQLLRSLVFVTTSIILCIVPQMGFIIAAETTFTDYSTQAGIKISRPTYGNPLWGDFDNDGAIDILVINHGARPSLLSNNGDGTFTDIQPQSGIADEGDRHGAAWGDYDNDGDQDLYITLGAARGNSLGKKTDQLYRNDMAGQFTDVTQVAGVSNAQGRGRSVNWIDINNDGYLDLFVKNYKTLNLLYRNNRDGSFTDIGQAAGIADAPGGISSWADFDGDGNMDLFIVSETKDQLWRNNGDGTFSDVTALSGMQDLSYGQGVAWGDYNNDGKIDLFIARGYYDIRDSLLWSSAHITFSDEESDEEDGLDFYTSGQKVTFDLYIKGCRDPNEVFIGETNSPISHVPVTLSSSNTRGQPVYTPGSNLGFYIWTDEDGWHIRWSSNGTVSYFYGKLTTDGVFTSVKPKNYHRETPKISSTLYRNNGDGTFSDVTESSKIIDISNARGASWGDYNNDGYLDLYIVDSGTIESNAPNMLFRNNGDGTFTDVTNAAHVLANVNGRGNGAAWGDFNNDGFLDLYVTNGWERPILKKQDGGNCLVHGPHLLYKNNGNDNKWLKISLVGSVSNRDAIGAKLGLLTDGKVQFREVNGGGGGQFFSQGSGPLHFGLGKAERIDELSIQWPSGVVQTLTALAPNQHLSVVEEGVSVTHGPIIGAVRPTATIIWMRTNQPARVQVEYSNKRDLSGSLRSEVISLTQGSDFAGELRLAELKPETSYFYKIWVNSSALPTVYRFQTSPRDSVVTTFSFAVLSDFHPEEAPVYASVAQGSPSFVIFLGDFDHRNPSTLSEMRTMHRNMRGNETAEGRDFAAHIRPLPFYHIWDDHDFGIDSADATFPGKDDALQAFREYYPTPPLPSVDGIWHKFRYAQAEFFMLDLRSQRDPNSTPDGPNKSMLGEEQKAWLKEMLLNSTARWKFLLSSVPFNASSKPKDSWGAFRTERTEIINFIRESNITGVIIISGDLHSGGAIDDGTNSKFPELSVPHANMVPQKCWTTETPGRWSEGIICGANNPGYGFITVSPESVSLQIKGVGGDTRDFLDIY